MNAAGGRVWWSAGVLAGMAMHSATHKEPTLTGGPRALGVRAHFARREMLPARTPALHEA
jgi:hypothetical protein